MYQAEHFRPSHRRSNIPDNIRRNSNIPPSKIRARSRTRAAGRDNAGPDWNPVSTASAARRRVCRARSAEPRRAGAGSSGAGNSGAAAGRCCNPA